MRSTEVKPAGENAKRGRPKTRTNDKMGPTPEHLLKRMMLAHGGDPTRTSTPLDYLRNRDWLTVEEHMIASQYRFLYGKGASRTPHVSAMDLNVKIPGHDSDLTLLLDEKALGRVRQEFVDVQRVIIQAFGQVGLNLLDDVVIYQKWAPWMYGDTDACLAWREGVLARLRQVLALLSEWIDLSRVVGPRGASLEHRPGS